MGTSVIAGNFIAFSILALINLPGNALGSASTIITGHYRASAGKWADNLSRNPASPLFYLSTISMTAIVWLSAPFSDIIVSIYTHDPDVNDVVVLLIWLSAVFMPILAISWVLPAGFKGARDVRFAMC